MPNTLKNNTETLPSWRRTVMADPLESFARIVYEASSIQEIQARTATHTIDRLNKAKRMLTDPTILDAPRAVRKEAIKREMHRASTSIAANQLQEIASASAAGAEAAIQIANTTSILEDSKESETPISSPDAAEPSEGDRAIIESKRVKGKLGAQLLKRYVFLRGIIDGIGAGFGFGDIYSQGILLAFGKLRSFNINDYCEDKTVLTTISAVGWSVAVGYGVRLYYRRRYIEGITLGHINLPPSSFPSNQVEQGGIRELARAQHFRALFNQSLEHTFFARLLKIGWHLQYPIRMLGQSFTATTIGDYIGLALCLNKQTPWYFMLLCALYTPIALAEIYTVRLEHRLAKISNEIGPERDSLPGIRLKLIPREFAWQHIIIPTLTSFINGATLGAFNARLVSLGNELINQGDPTSRPTINASIASAASLGAIQGSTAALYGLAAQVRISGMANYIQLLRIYIELTAKDDRETIAWLTDEKNVYLDNLIKHGKNLNIPFIIPRGGEWKILIAAAIRSAFPMITWMIDIQMFTNIQDDDARWAMLVTWVIALGISITQAYTTLMRDRLSGMLDTAYNELTDFIENHLGVTLNDAVHEMERISEQLPLSPLAQPRARATVPILDNSIQAPVATDGWQTVRNAFSTMASVLFPCCRRNTAPDGYRELPEEDARLGSTQAPTATLGV